MKLEKNVMTPKLINRKFSKKNIKLLFFMKSTVLALEVNLGHQNMAYIPLTTSIIISARLIMLKNKLFLYVTIQIRNKLKIKSTIYLSQLWRYWE